MDVFLGAVIGLLRGMLWLLPDWSPDPGMFATTGAAVGGGAFAMNGYFPVAMLVTALVAIYGLKVLLLAWRLVVFVWQIMPFKFS